MNGPVQLAFRSKNNNFEFIENFTSFGSYMSLVIMRITTPGIRIPYYFPVGKGTDITLLHYTCIIHV